MEISEVRKRVLETIDRSRRRAAERRARSDEAGRAYQVFLDATAIPLLRQIAAALKAAGYPFTVMTPAGAVRLTSDRSAEDFIELSLDSGDDLPRIVARVSRVRGRHRIDAERVVGDGSPAALTEETLLAFLMKELEPFVER